MHRTLSAGKAWKRWRRWSRPVRRGVGATWPSLVCRSSSPSLCEAHAHAGLAGCLEPGRLPRGPAGSWGDTREPGAAGRGGAAQSRGRRRGEPSKSRRKPEVDRPRGRVRGGSWEAAGGRRRGQTGLVGDGGGPHSPPPGLQIVVAAAEAAPGPERSTGPRGRVWDPRLPSGRPAHSQRGSGRADLHLGADGPSLRGEQRVSVWRLSDRESGPGRRRGHSRGACSVQAGERWGCRLKAPPHQDSAEWRPSVCERLRRSWACVWKLQLAGLRVGGGPSKMELERDPGLGVASGPPGSLPAPQRYGTTRAASTPSPGGRGGDRGAPGQGGDGTLPRPN